MEAEGRHGVSDTACRRRERRRCLQIRAAARGFIGVAACYASDAKQFLSLIVERRELIVVDRPVDQLGTEIG